MLISYVLLLAVTRAAWSSSVAAAEETTEECYSLSDSLVQNRHSAQQRQTNTREDPQACSLPVCVFHGPNAPRLWVAGHTDGAGHRMQNVIKGIAMAQRLGMNFGGVVGPESLTDQRLNFSVVAANFFGTATKDVGGILAWRGGEHPAFDFSFGSPWELEGHRDEISDGTNVWMPVANEFDWNSSVPDSLFFTADLRNRLGAPLASRPLLFTPGKTVVAMHLRRGDLHRDDIRATPNEYYYDIADKIKEFLPSAEFHIWAAIKDQVNGNYWRNEDFDGFRLKGMQVHLDDGVDDENSLIATWAHLAFANIFVASQSSFSEVPMILNCRCVISVGYMGLDNWMNGKEPGRESYHNELKACVQRSQGATQC